MNIQAEVMAAVYLGGSEKPKPPPASSELSIPGGFNLAPSKSNQRAFFSSFFSSFASHSNSNTLSKVSNDPLPEEKKKTDLKEVITSTIVLTIYSAHASVN